jgi:acid stress-induced BolA-like protein IbaG/YrbA
MTSERAAALAAELRNRFGGEVEAEAVNGSGRFRFIVVSDRFDRMPHLQRQDAVWEVVDTVLSREETLDVSLVLTLAPTDYPETNIV